MRLRSATLSFVLCFSSWLLVSGIATPVVTVGQTVAIQPGPPEPVAEIWSQSVIHSAVFSPDGQSVLTGNGYGSAQLWNAATGKKIGKALRHPKDEIPTISLIYGFTLGGLTGVQLYSGMRDLGAAYHFGMMKRVSEYSDEPLPVPKDIQIAAFSPDGKLIVTGSADGSARVWERADEEWKRIGAPINLMTSLYSVQFSSDSTRLVIAAFRSDARIWDARTGKPLGKPLQHRDVIHCAAFSADGRRVVTASWDGSARIWDAMTGEPITAPLVHPSGQIPEYAMINPDGSRIVTSTTSNVAFIWDVSTGKQIGAPLKNKHGNLEAFALSPDGTRIAMAGDDGTVQLWDAATGKQSGKPMSHTPKVYCVGFSPDGKRLATGSVDQSARVWNIADSSPLSPPLPHRAGVNSVRFSQDGTRLLTTIHPSPDDFFASIWDVSDYKP
ncbi:MAG: WD40 repeat domain-containing protein [Candidatus Methylacidiphilales bacterium]